MSVLLKSTSRLQKADGSSLPSQASSNRWSGLDWLRAGAALAVVLLHAGIPYMAWPLPGLEWCVRSETTSPLVDAVCWAIDTSVMPVFFLMGGFLTAGVWKRLGKDSMRFLKHRTRRLLVPLAVGVVLVLPGSVYVWLMGWYTQRMITWKMVLSLKLPSPLCEQFWGVAHLWYLDCLWLISVMVCVIYWGPVARRLEWLPTAAMKPDFWKLPILAGLSGIVMYVDPSFLIGFEQGWGPNPVAVVFYGLFFAAGWAWPGALSPSLDGNWKWRLPAAALLFPVLLSAIHRHVESPMVGRDLLGLCCLFSLVSWLGATGMFGAARSLPHSKTPASLAYLAEASFWMYLIHHPFCGFTQLALLNSTLGPEVKWLLSFGTSTWLSLATYAICVRGTIIGRLMDGRTAVASNPVEMSPGGSAPMIPAATILAMPAHHVEPSAEQLGKVG